MSVCHCGLEGWDERKIWKYLEDFFSAKVTENRPFDLLPQKEARESFCQVFDIFPRGEVLNFGGLYLHEWQKIMVQWQMYEGKYFQSHGASGIGVLLVEMETSVGAEKRSE